VISDMNAIVRIAERDAWQETMAQVAAGSQAALAQLFDGTSRSVYRVALRIVKDEAAAEDIALDVYLQVWRKAASFDPVRGTVSSWLVTLARSRAIDWLRACKARRARQEQELSEVTLYDRGPSPEHAAIEAGRVRAMRSAMASLCPDQKHVIELAYFSELSHSEIATRSGLPLGTVKSRSRTGTLRLRDLLSGPSLVAENKRAGWPPAPSGSYVTPLEGQLQ
jgi:RNA polymerase sigma-70 factor, ECF subfamily